MELGWWIYGGRAPPTYAHATKEGKGPAERKKKQKRKRGYEELRERKRGYKELKRDLSTPKEARGLANFKNHPRRSKFGRLHSTVQKITVDIFCPQMYM